jgi:hypothetical protein
MPEEILNIDYHVRRMVVEALNRFPTKVKAYLALGVTEKQLYNLIKQYEIKKSAEGIYYTEQKQGSPCTRSN